MSGADRIRSPEEHMPYFVLFCRAIFIVVFLWAIVGKSYPRGRFDAFAASIAAARLVPGNFARPVAVAAVVSEAIVVSLLVLPATYRFGLIWAAVTLLVFTGALQRFRSRAVPCGCFGSSRTRVGSRSMQRNWTLIALCVLAGAAAFGWPPGPVTVAGAAVAATAGVAAVLAVVVLDELVTPRAAGD
jgi:Methylamine utilisation protein MauE